MHGFARICTVKHSLARLCTDLHGSAQFGTGWHGFARSCMDWHRLPRNTFMNRCEDVAVVHARACNGSDTKLRSLLHYVVSTGVAL